MLSIYTDKKDLAWQVIEKSPNPTYVKNEQGRFIIANSAYANTHEVNLDELLEKGVIETDYAHERDLEVLRNGTTVTIEEFYRLADGRKAWFKTTKSAFTHQDGRRYLMSVSSDITALKAVEHMAEAAPEPKTPAQDSSATTMAAQSQALYDFSGLGELKDDEDFIRKMQKMFLDTVPEQLHDLAKAVEAGEFNKVASIAHKLKATYGNIGMEEAAAAMKKMEQYACNSSLPQEAVALLKKVEEATEAVAAVFSAQLHTQS